MANGKLFRYRAKQRLARDVPFDVILKLSRRRYSSRSQWVILESKGW